MKKQTDAATTLFEIRSRRIERQQLKARSEAFRRSLRASIAKRREVMANLPERKRLYLHLKDLTRLCGANTPLSRGELTVVLPADFSLIRNPDESLTAIARCMYLARKAGERPIQVDYRRVEALDYSAEALLAFCVTETLSHLRNLDRPSPTFEGRYPEDPNTARMLRDAGVVARIATDRSGSLGVENGDSYQTYQESSLSEADTGSGASRIDNKAVAGVQNWLDDCLEITDRSLTPNARAELGEYVGEIIDNIIEHSGERIWLAEGFLDHNEKPYECELLIFNFGRSFAETYLSLPADHFARAQIREYIETHLSRNRENEEVLYTVAALQEGESTKNDDEYSTRGQGTCELISFFQDVSEECSDPNLCDMAIISGETYVHFDGSYRLSEKESDKRRFIFFNSAESPQQPPDPKYVRRLDETHFPGTLIAIRFPITSILEDAS